VLVISRIPHDDYFVDSDVTSLAFGIPQVENAAFNTQYFSPQARSAAAIDVDPFTNEFRKKTFHVFDFRFAIADLLPGAIVVSLRSQGSQSKIKNRQSKISYFFPFLNVILTSGNASGSPCCWRSNFKRS